MVRNRNKMEYYSFKEPIQLINFKKLLCFHKTQFG